MATVYHRDQPGAPAITYSTNIRACFTALKSVLISCLVTGYGTQPAAGWTLVAEGDNYVVLRNASGSGYLGISHRNTTFALFQVTVAATYEGVNAEGVIQGDGAKTGSSASLVPHSLPYFPFYSSASCTWMMVADGNSFFLSSPNRGTSAEALNLESGEATYALVLYGGDDSNGNFIVCGMQNTTATNITASSSLFQPDAGFTSLRYPDTGLLVDTGAIVANTPARSGIYTEARLSFNPAHTGRYMPKLYPSKLSWVYQSGHAGYFRGLALAAELTAYYVGHQARVLGYSGPALTTRTANTPVDLGDGNTWFVVPGDSGRMLPLLMTDSPEFW